MKKITLIALAALFVAVSSFAQEQVTLSQKHVEAAARLAAGKNLKKQPSKKSLHLQKGPEQQKSLRSAIAVHNQLTGKKASKKQQPKALRRASQDIISEQPAGEQVLYNRSGNAYYYSYWFGLGSTQLSGAVGNVVFGADNKVYIKDLVSQAGAGIWVEGTISGNAITIQLPQRAIDYSEYGYNLEVSRLTVSGNTYVKASNQTLQLTYNATTGAISSPSGVTVGLTYDDDDSWSGYADYNISFTKNTDPLVEAPAGLQTSPYVLSAPGYQGSIVNVGFSGNDVYVQGIDPNLPETWIKGTIEGDQVKFQSGQYIGPDEVAGYHQYLLAATGEELYDDYYDEYYTEYSLATGDITFKYDAATKTLSESSTFLINAGKTNVNYLYAFDKAKIASFVEVAATPATPEISELYEGGFSYFSSGYGWGYLAFDLPVADVDGNYILPEKLTYQLYTKVNGEVKPLPLSWWDYIYQEEETLAELPFDYSDGWDVYSTGTSKSIYYYVVGPEEYGVQAIYRGAGEERRSEIAWARTQELGAEVQPAAATPAYPDATISATDNKIDYGFYTGDEKVKVVTNNYKPETYDVGIKLSDPALVGTLIESITIPVQEVGGVSDINVFLTSQLRVEDGKNAADLVVKAVTPSEAGFITVTLDKPYTIPEGGVYAGYSLTVNNVDDYEVNATPVSITNQVNAGGLYIHTSDGILKWLDFSELFGGSALIQVKLAGGSIKGNAASVAAAASQYVKTGEPSTVPLTIVNHGTQGVQSVDVEYSVAGQGGSKTVNVGIDAFFGKSATVEVEIPAISAKGNYELAVNVAKVNGVANEDAAATTTVNYIALNTVPKKRSLLEEYTGFWCGWCPRGFVGVEKLAELYPDEYVLASYHNDDELEVMYSDEFPSVVTGFPAGWMDRDVELDAYYGTGEDDFGIADDLAARNREFGYADIALESSLKEDGKTIEVNTSLTFPYDLTGGNFSVEYILIADGLTDPSWGQSNYYAGQSKGTPLYMDEFTLTDDSYVYGLVFSNVAVQTSELLGGANQTITTASADIPVALQYTFNLDNVYNTDYQPILQENTTLKVAALLIDNATGAVVNANKAGLGGSAAGIKTLDYLTISLFDYSVYDLSGRQLSNAKLSNGQMKRGLNIVKHADGTARKVIVK